MGLLLAPGGHCRLTGEDSTNIPRASPTRDLRSGRASSRAGAADGPRRELAVADAQPERRSAAQWPRAGRHSAQVRATPAGAWRARVAQRCSQ
jgi:hypothetical protein